MNIRYGVTVSTLRFQDNCERRGDRGSIPRIGEVNISFFLFAASLDLFLARSNGFACTTRIKWLDPQTVPCRFQYMKSTYQSDNQGGSCAAPSILVLLEGWRTTIRPAPPQMQLHLSG